MTTPLDILATNVMDLSTPGHSYLTIKFGPDLEGYETNAGLIQTFSCELVEDGTENNTTTFPTPWAAQDYGYAHINSNAVITAVNALEGYTAYHKGHMVRVPRATNYGDAQAYGLANDLSATWSAYQEAIDGAVEGLEINLVDHTNAVDAHSAIISPILTLIGDKVDKVTGKALSTNDYTSTEKTKLSGIATSATANDTDANLKARANHTGTQSADTITDGTTNKAYTATEKTKLAGVAAGATVNSSDATLLARANHTGTQAISTVSGLQTALDAKVDTSRTLAGLDLSANRTAATLRSAIMSTQTHIADAPTDLVTDCPTDADTNASILSLLTIGTALNANATKQNSGFTKCNANFVKTNTGFTRLNLINDAIEINNLMAA